MALEMKQACEKYGTAIAAPDRAFICTFECTFCARSTEQMQHIGPHGGGERARPLRRKSS